MKDKEYSMLSTIDCIIPLNGYFVYIYRQINAK
jgi:hypothetical protein